MFMQTMWHWQNAFQFGTVSKKGIYYYDINQNSFSRVYFRTRLLVDLFVVFKSRGAVTRHIFLVCENNFFNFSIFEFIRKYKAINLFVTNDPKRLQITADAICSNITGCTQLSPCQLYNYYDSITIPKFLSLNEFQAIWFRIGLLTVVKLFTTQILFMHVTDNSYQIIFNVNAPT